MIKDSDQKQWDDFVLTNNGGFLQSSCWTRFQENLGRITWKLKINQVQALVVKYELPFGRCYLYSPRGPLVAKSDKISNFQFLISKVIELAQKENAIFYRFEPLEPICNSYIRKKFVIRRQTDVQPSRTLILDLRKSEEELLANMHPKTRYNIRLAKKHGVEVYEGASDVEKFLDLLHKTSRRDKFKPYRDNYYRRLVEIDPNFVKLYLARYKGEILAANVIVFFGDTVTYIHGASSNKHRRVMAPHLLHWHVITEAKKQGFTYYDFWGIDEKKWPGLTRFKKSFSGKEVIYPGTFDLVLNKKWYFLYKVGKCLF